MKGRRPAPSRKRQVLERDNYTCIDCGCNDRELLTVDHIIPRSKGGPSFMANLITRCEPCNKAKGDAIGTDIVRDPLEDLFREIGT